MWESHTVGSLHNFFPQKVGIDSLEGEDEEGGEEYWEEEEEEEN